jgi:hypothetical protein
MLACEPLWTRVASSTAGTTREATRPIYTSVLQILGIKALYDQDKYTAYGTNRFHFWLHESGIADVTRKEQTKPIAYLPQLW